MWNTGKLCILEIATISLAEMYRRNESRAVECYWNVEKIAEYEYHSAITAKNGMLMMILGIS